MNFPSVLKDNPVVKMEYLSHLIGSARCTLIFSRNKRLSSQVREEKNRIRKYQRELEKLWNQL